MVTRFPFACFRSALTLTLILLPWALPASAQSVTGMAGSEVTSNAQIQNAAQAAEEAAKAAAVGAENYRGANIAELQALQEMQKLMNLVEQECDRVLHPPHPPGGEEEEDGEEDGEVDPPS